MEENSDNQSGHISDIGVLDLRFAKTAEDLSRIKSISDVGVVLVPERLAGAFAGIPVSDVGTIVRLPDDSEASLMSGQVKVTGESLKNGDPNKILVVVGQFWVTTRVESVGYKEIRVFGQMFVPKGSESVIGPKLAEVSGQVLFVPENARTIMGEEEMGAEFLSYLSGSTAFIVMGSLRIEGDVTVDLLREKVSEIVLMGEITAPKWLIPILQVLTVEKLGTIRSA